MQKCSNLFRDEDGRHVLAGINATYSKAEHQILHLSIYFWTCIWKNYTYNIFGKGCSSAGPFSITLQDQLQTSNNMVVKPGMQGFRGFIPFPLHLPFYIPDEFNSFQFVSCGKRIEAMKFMERINVYDVKVWGCLLILILSIVLILHLISFVTNRIEHGRSTIKNVMSMLLLFL